MNTLKIGPVFFLLASLLYLGSCSKTGPVGPQGVQGPQGEQGPAGPQGIAGANGSTIYSGSSAPSTDIGRAGDYYIDMAASNLYGPKTDAGWGDPLSLKGAQGETGPQGSQGPQGETGPQGGTGPEGPKGDKGDTGDTGTPGQNGKDGTQILSGTSTPSSSIGSIGDYYWNTSDYSLYGPKSASGWGSGVTLRGAKGDKGDKGDPGTANVMYSGWLKFHWSNVFTYEDIMYVHEPKITLDFINNGGTILSYLLVLQTTATDTSAALMHSIPRSIPGTAVGYSSGSKFDFEIDYDAIASNIRIDVTSDGPLPVAFLQDFLFVPDPVNPLYNRYRFRYILIPGGVHLRRSSPPPDPKDYKSTCKYYGIPE